jgi:hypothetical protein
MIESRTEMIERPAMEICPLELRKMFKVFSACSRNFMSALAFYECLYCQDTSLESNQPGDFDKLFWKSHIPPSTFARNIEVDIAHIEKLIDRFRLQRKMVTTIRILSTWPTLSLAIIRNLVGFKILRKRWQFFETPCPCRDRTVSCRPEGGIFALASHLTQTLRFCPIDWHYVEWMELLIIHPRRGFTGWRVSDNSIRSAEDAGPVNGRTVADKRTNASAGSTRGGIGWLTEDMLSIVWKIDCSPTSTTGSTCPSTSETEGASAGGDRVGEK